MTADVPLVTALPDALVETDRWLCWRTEQHNGTETKVPINPHTGSFGSATNDDSWASFETAREYAVDGPVDGLGFVFTAEGPFVGVDLDDCRVPETGTLTDDAAAIVERLASYTEVSPSGTGVHVLVKGSLPGDRNRSGWVECYDDARFFTVTGDHVDGTPATIESRTSELGAVYAAYVEPDEPSGESDSDQPTSSADEPMSDDDQSGATADSQQESDQAQSADSTARNGLSDEEVVERAQAAANGEKFSRLWNGATSGYESHSEADMALCALLAFWTGGDRQQIDRLFRQSGLMREKWDERHYADGSTYGEKTIDRVLAGTDEFYQPASESATTDDDDESGDTASYASAGTHDTEELLTEVVALRREVEELTAREDQYLETIAELRTQVERLEAANERLQAERDGAVDDSEGTNRAGDTTRASSSQSLLARTLQRVSWR